MRKQLCYWLTITGILLAFASLMGCDRSPANLGPEYHKGKCVVCKRSTMVKDRLMNPNTQYNVTVCWRDECQRKFGADMLEYTDPSKMPGPEDFPMPEGESAPAPTGQ